MNYFLGIDIGTSGVKTLLIDEKGKTISKFTSEYPLYTPHANWAEQEPEDWFKATLISIQKVVKESKIDPKRISAIGLSGQMHSSVFLDKDMKVIRPAILWCDTRTKKECLKITSRIGKDKLKNLVANPALEGFTLPKILWLKNNEAKNYSKVSKVVLPKDYIRFRLTNELLMEVSDASGTLMFDVKKRRWSSELLDLVKIPKSFLVEVRESISICGRITRTISDITGLKEGTPVVGGGADNTCGAVGTGVVKSGRVLASLGTSGVIFAHSEKVKIDPLMRVHTFCHSVPNKWYLMGVMLSAGGAFRWFRDTFAGMDKIMAKKEKADVYDILIRQAKKVKPGSEGLFFLPYLMGERTPHQSADARACYIGATARHTYSHFIRATLEGITFGMKDSLEIMRKLGVDINQIRLTGGGAKNKFWKQLQANIYESEVAVVNSIEGPAFGAALMAGVGAGFYKTIEEATENTVKVIENIAPQKEEVKIYKEYYDIFKNLYPTLNGAFLKISKVI